MFLRFLVMAFLATATMASAEPNTPPAPKAPASPCSDLVKKLDDIYNRLYNVDTRPLAFDMYRTFRDSIQNLHDDTADLNNLCAGGSTEPHLQSLYKSRDLNWKGSVSWDSPCPNADFATSKNEFGETSVRECFRDSYLDCQITSRVRVYNVSGSKNSDSTWNCSAKMDVVITAKK